MHGRTPPSRQKAAMRRGRNARANPSVKAKNASAEGQERSCDPLRQGENRRCGGAGKVARTPPREFPEIVILREDPLI